MTVWCLQYYPNDYLSALDLDGVRGAAEFFAPSLHASRESAMRAAEAEAADQWQDVWGECPDALPNPGQFPWEAADPTNPDECEWVVEVDDVAIFRVFPAVVNA